MITGYKKALLTTAVVMAVSGFNVYAAPDIANSNMSQSEMYNVTQGKTEGQAGDIDASAATSDSSKTTTLQASGDNDQSGVDISNTAQASLADTASMYLAPDDDKAIAKAAGKTITSIDFDGIPEEVKAKLVPLLTEKTGDKVSVEGVRNDVAALGGTGVFSQISPQFGAVKEGVTLTFRMVSNPVIHKVTFEGNTVFSDDELRQILAVPKDSVLNFVQVSRNIKAIDDLYIQQGYILASIPDVTVTKNGTLKVNIAEGKIEDIQIAGNEKTKDKVILRELRFKKGEPFNKFLASRSMERLYNLGIFEDVNMKLLPGNENHDVIIEIDVVEQKTGVVTVGAGYSESDGMVGILGLTENNFRGTGDKVNVRWEFGGSSHGKNYEISYTHPYINDNGDALGFTVFDRRYKYDDYDSNGDTIAEYDKRRKGWNFTWGRVSDEYRTNYLNFESVKESYDDEDGFQWGSGASKETAATKAKWRKAIFDNFGRTNSLTFTHVYDNRDNYFNASKGRRLSFSAQWGGHGLGGNYDFYKFTTEGRFYKGLGNGHILALRVMAGYIDGNVSYGNLFDLGGSNTLRGYEDDQFKGSKMYAATLEYRFPIAKKVQGVVFTDMGSTWGIDEGKIPWYKDDNSLNFSVGVGLRLQTPIGPIRLDYGHGDRNKFHFSFGTQF